VSLWLELALSPSALWEVVNGESAILGVFAFSTGEPRIERA